MPGGKGDAKAPHPFSFCSFWRHIVPFGAIVIEPTCQMQLLHQLQIHGIIVYTIQVPKWISQLIKLLFVATGWRWPEYNQHCTS